MVRVRKIGNKSRYNDKYRSIFLSDRFQKMGALYINAKQNHSVLAPASRSNRNIHARYSNGIDITGDMTIPFEKIAGRKPRNANEHDIVITKAPFESVSKMVCYVTLYKNHILHYLDETPKWIKSKDS
ncbi:hypothetical protein TEQG_07767 [Trichophyton equinum CBS 127.97]|uniref:Uncharacterized protein n=1 Tax=Trichophyton equinum (strain ATCC MYA-4606 / CBS 127.97) TaxID=559882 RepID=F2Q3U2_TRIEC|nr:hypothetical protein TEQG_07767 [Trichophyton equinum CBS 127.97]